MPFCYRTTWMESDIYIFYISDFCCCCCCFCTPSVLHVWNHSLKVQFHGVMTLQQRWQQISSTQKITVAPCDSDMNRSMWQWHELIHVAVTWTDPCKNDTDLHCCCHHITTLLLHWTKGIRHSQSFRFLLSLLQLLNCYCTANVDLQTKDRLKKKRKIKNDRFSWTHTGLLQ